MEKDNIIIEIAVQLRKLNFFSVKQFTDEQFVDMAKFITETEPEITARDIELIFGLFATNEYRFDGREVIRNIFGGYYTLLQKRIKYYYDKKYDNRDEAGFANTKSLAAKYKNYKPAPEERI